MSPIELVVKSTILVAAVLAFVPLLKGASAALRHRIYALCLVGLVALPFLADRAPEIPIQHPAAPVRWQTGPLTELPESLAPTAASDKRQAPTIDMATVQREHEEFDRSVYVTLAWLVGFAVVLIRTISGLRFARSLAALGRDVASDPALGLPPHTRMVRSPAVDVAMTFGFLRPTVVLPAEFEAWSDEGRRSVLLHEGAHIRRGDWAWLLFARLVCAVYWFNPFVWVAEARMRAESERAADDAVLRAGVPATSYAQLLVSLAASIRKGRGTSLALSIVERGTLRSRVAGILSANRRREPLARRVALGAALTLGAVVVAFAGAQWVAGPLVSHDGGLDLGHGRRVQVVAITEMRGDRAVSWNIRGEIMPRPFVIQKDLMKSLAFVDKEPLGNVRARYVILSANASLDEWPTFRASPNGEALQPQSYNGFTKDNVYFQEQNALGGSYQVVRLLVPSGDDRASLHAVVPTGDWRQEGEVRITDGNPISGSGSLPKLEVTSAAFPSQYVKSTIRFDLPSRFRDLQAFVRLAPNANTGWSFEREAGPKEITSELPLAKIGSVRLFSRPVRETVLADLPMDPNLRAAYEPLSLQLPHEVKAVNGVARFANGATLSLDRLESETAAWKSDGTRLAIGKRAWDPSVKLGDEPARFVKIRFRRPDDTEYRAFDLFDGEGRGFPSNQHFTTFERGSVLFGSMPLVAKSLRSTDLLVRYTPVDYRTVTRARLNVTPGFRSSFDKEGKLRVEFPAKLLDNLNGEDVSLVPFDAHGQNPSKSGYAYGITGGVVTFDLSKAAAHRVTQLEIKARPYVWVRFADIPLYPQR